jgi:hypothetical protein
MLDGTSLSQAGRKQDSLRAHLVSMVSMALEFFMVNGSSIQQCTSYWDRHIAQAAAQSLRYHRNSLRS